MRKKKSKNDRVSTSLDIFLHKRLKLYCVENDELIFDAIDFIVDYYFNKIGDQQDG